MRHLSIILLCSAIGFAATGARAQDTSVVVPSGNWTNPSNWSNGVPDASMDISIGDANYPNVAITVYSGTDAEVDYLSLGGWWDFPVAHYSGSGSIEIEAGASLTTSGGRWGLGNGNDGTMATMVVNGLFETTGRLDIGGYSPANVTIGTGGTIHVWGSLNIGHPSYMNEGWNYEFNQLGGTVHVDQWGGGFYISGWAGTTATLYKASGTSLIQAHGVNGYTGNGFWQMGGTFEVAGDVTLEAPNGPAIFGTDWPNVEHSPIIKLSGTDPKLTVSSAYDVFMVYPADWTTDPSIPKSGSEPVQIDVSDLDLSQSGTWVTVIDVVEGTLQFGDQVAFVDGTDPNEWQLQVIGNDVQVKQRYEQQCIGGIVDDDDLSLLLANWGIGDEWGEGDLNEDGTVDDDDLSLLLANWGGCSPFGPPPVVPEPATLVLLAVGAVLALRQRHSRAGGRA